jgi:hypothetical protein
MKRQIHAHRIDPPIPSAAYDWQATLVGYEPGDPVGHGPTRTAAITDLIERWSDRDPELEAMLEVLEATPTGQIDLTTAADMLQGAIDSKGHKS